jgi:hypothetical protein
MLGSLEIVFFLASLALMIVIDDFILWLTALRSFVSLRKAKNTADGVVRLAGSCSELRGIA